MVQSLIAITYKDLWDDFDTFDPVALLKDVPTVSALDFVVERQNKVLYAFSDEQEQQKLFYEMCCFLDGTPKNRAIYFLGNHPNISMLSTETCLNFYLMALQAHNERDEQLSAIDKVKIYKALLFATSYWTDFQAKGIAQLKNDPIGMMLRIDLPTIEFKVPKDFRVQIYKACKFFEFCSEDS